MSKVSLSGNNWVDLRDEETITSGQRKALVRGIDAAEDGLSSVDILLTHLIIEWSFTAPVPQPVPGRPGAVNNVGSIDNLVSTDVDKMALEARRILRAITPDFDPNPNPASPTSPS